MGPPLASKYLNDGAKVEWRADLESGMLTGHFAMPEAFAILFVFAAFAAVWIGSWLHSRNPANHQPAENAARLRHHAAWLRQRIERARQEKWDPDMMAKLEAELATISGELAAIDGLRTAPVSS